jgi:hypothetical protein
MYFNRNNRHKLSKSWKAESFENQYFIPLSKMLIISTNYLILLWQSGKLRFVFQAWHEKGVGFRVPK